MIVIGWFYYESNESEIFTHIRSLDDGTFPADPDDWTPDDVDRAFPGAPERQVEKLAVIRNPGNTIDSTTLRHDATFHLLEVILERALEAGDNVLLETLGHFFVTLYQQLTAPSEKWLETRAGST